MCTRRRTILSLMFLGITFPYLHSCISIDLPGQVTFLGTGSIVLKGSMSDSATDACPVWESDRGELFVLFQDKNLSNEDFDALITPGTQSRLLLQGRPDLGTVCLEGAENAVVLGVFELDGVDQVETKFEDLRIRTDALSEDVRMGLSIRRDEIASDLEDYLVDLETRLQERKDQFESEVRAAIDEVRDKLSNASLVDDRVTEFVQSLNDRIDQGAGGFEKARDDLRNQINERIEESTEVVQLALEAARERLEQRRGLQLPSNEALIEAFRNRIAGIQGQLEGDFGQRQSELRSELDEIGDQFENNLQNNIDRLVGRITSTTSDWDNAIPLILEEQGSLIDQVVDQIAMSRANLRTRIRSALQASVDQLESEMRPSLLDAVDQAFAGLAAAVEPES